MWALLPEGVMQVGLAAQGSWCWASTQRSWHTIFFLQTLCTVISAVIFEGKGKIKHSPLSESGTHPAHIEVMSQVS